MESEKNPCQGGEVTGIIISRSLLAEHGYDPDLPTQEQMKIIARELFEYWDVSGGFKDELASAPCGTYSVLTPIKLKTMINTETMEGKISSDDNVQKIISAANRKGWNVSTDEREKGAIQFEFSQFTPAGQDFNFSATMTDGNPAILIEEVKRYYESFDVDEEAYLWIGPDGHGQNGAPYHIKDIVSDMEAAEEMVYQLYEALNEIF